MTAPDRMPIAVRAYTAPTRRRHNTVARGNDEPSEWALVFDCETTTDAAQRLRFGVYQVRKHETLSESGLFYDSEVLSVSELELLKAYAERHGMKARPRAEFIERVFYVVGFDLRGTIAGFNLPFDLSRVAIDHSAARLSMRGGFSFKLSPSQYRPPVRVKNLSRRAALIDFAAPRGQPTPRGSRNRGLDTPKHSGFFVDCSTLASALFSDGFSLDSLCKQLGTVTQKAPDARHGEPLSVKYLDYACTDVQATWECCCALRREYLSHGVATPLHRVLSEASIGKAYLKAMGVRPFLEKQPDVLPPLLGKLMSAYYGGRAEVRWRRTVKRVRYCDFKSMYPTVNALMDLWRLVIAEHIDPVDATEVAREFLRDAALADFQHRAAWRYLGVIVRVRPDHDLFPVRGKFANGPMYTIGLNYLTCDSGLWMTLADCVAAKILSGKTPEVLQAIAFKPSSPQPDLQPIELFGNDAYTVDPLSDDVFSQLIDLRDHAKAQGDPRERAMKIIANATSYGIFIEILRDDAATSEPVPVYGPSGGRRIVETKAIEQPGRFFNPIVAVLITGAARLMLALTERLVVDAGLDWAFCDTDSIAIVRPDDVTDTEFDARCADIVSWFEPLSPYRKQGSILKVEDVNFNDNGEPAPLYCFAISSKRYALFNLDDVGRPILRKATAHGLGHLLAPYPEEEAPEEIPAPHYALAEIGVERWQYDFWYGMVGAALSQHAENVSLDYHSALTLPARTRFGVSSPNLETWLAAYNATRPYAHRIRPFGFMLSLQARKEFVCEIDADASVHLGRPKNLVALKPIAPFERDPVRAAALAFDRETGARIETILLRSYAEALAQYHLHPEDKFLNGDYWDRGRTERRHVIASCVRLVGKEANRWEERECTNGDKEEVLDLGPMLRRTGPLAVVDT